MPARPTFRLQRYFSIASGVAILVVSFALSLAYRAQETREQIGFGESRNVWMAQTFANAIAPEFAAHLAKPFPGAASLRADPETARLHRRLTEMAQRVPVIKTKIYNGDGVAIYSSVTSEIGEEKSGNFAFRDARAGKTVSELTHRGTMSVSEGRIENVDVVSTYIPILRPDGSIEAVFEIYTDVTEALRGVERESRRLVAILLAIFATLYGTLLLIVRRADRILVGQYGELAAKEEEIRAKNVELAAASRAKTEFLSSMSHELRTPMNAILGFAQLLPSEPAAPLNDNQRRFVDEIVKAGQHLLELINEVLDLARIEAGKLTLSVEPVSVAAVVAECMPLVQNIARESGVRLEPPPIDPGLRVMADHTRLKQSVLNLLGNAIKYNRKGGRVAVAVTRSANGGHRIAVSDSGVGIPQARHGEIFQPFHRLDMDASVEGTGIGLALTKNLVEAMGGAIGFDSEPAVGSTFWIELPEAPADSAPYARGTLERAPNPAVAPERTLLYIEDNPANMLLMQVIAKRMSLRFLGAHNAQVGLALAAAERPDIVIMDINLPQVDGYEALARLRANPATAGIPVMALSANAMQKDVERGLAAGFARYATKPVQVDNLREAISEILEVHA